LARLDAFTRTIESRLDPRADVDAAVAQERQISRARGGRTVVDDVARPARTRRSGREQPRLF